MPEALENDHDLLVKLDTKVDLMIKSQTDFISVSTSNVKEMVERIVRLEVKDSRDSEKVASINADVQRSLNNSARITDAFVAIENLRIEIAKIQVEKTNLQNEIVDLKKKSNLFDILNAIGFTASGIIGFIFGKR